MVDGKSVKLGEKDYVVPPLNLKALRRLLPSIEQLKSSGIPSNEDMDVIVDIVHTALLRNYPELTKAEVEDGLDMANMKVVLGIVLGQSGLSQGNTVAATVTP